MNMLYFHKIHLNTIHMASFPVLPSYPPTYKVIKFCIKSMT